MDYSYQQGSFFYKKREESKTKKILLSLSIISIFIGMLFPFSPLKSSLSQTLSSISPVSANVRGEHQVFSFAPGWSEGRMSRVQLDGINVLSYFDVQINANGTLNKNTTGYKIFRTQKTKNLFQKAHSNGTKVFLTLTITDNDTIKKFLTNKGAQKNLTDEVTKVVEESGIDGVNLTIEFTEDGSGKNYRERLNEFTLSFTRHMHLLTPASQVSFSVSNRDIGQPLYDLSTLAETVDLVFALAYDYAVPESKNALPTSPLHGGNSEDYWKNVSKSVDPLLHTIPAEKLILETAWYGNGSNYPLYQVKANEGDSEPNRNTLSTPLAQQTIDQIVQGVPKKSREAARKNLPLIAKALEDEKILNPQVLAYALATIEHETAGTFEPIGEIKGARSARGRGYEGGTNYFGRGFIQITHLRNYKEFGKRIGLGEKLAENPDLALEPEISAKILAAFFKDNGIANLATKGKFVQARTPINPDNFGRSIARLASKYLKG